jgi:hypothetical protein
MLSFGSAKVGTPALADPDPLEAPTKAQPGSQEGMAAATCPPANTSKEEGAAADRPEAVADLPEEAATTSTEPPKIPCKMFTMCIIHPSF